MPSSRPTRSRGGGRSVRLDDRDGLLTRSPSEGGDAACATSRGTSAASRFAGLCQPRPLVLPGLHGRLAPPCVPGRRCSWRRSRPGRERPRTPGISSGGHWSGLDRLTPHDEQTARSLEPAGLPELPAVKLPPCTPACSRTRPSGVVDRLRQPGPGESFHREVFHVTAGSRGRSPWRAWWRKSRRRLRDAGVRPRDRHAGLLPVTASLLLAGQVRLAFLSFGSAPRRNRGAATSSRRPSPRSGPGRGRCRTPSGSASEPRRRPDARTRRRTGPPRPGHRTDVARRAARGTSGRERRPIFGSREPPVAQDLERAFAVNRTACRESFPDRNRGGADLRPFPLSRRGSRRNFRYASFRSARACWSTTDGHLAQPRSLRRPA